MGKGERCDCQDWKKWVEADTGVWMFAYTHGIKYDGPLYKFCPFCGKTLTPIQEATNGQES
jgi:hypothetical protein